MEPCRDGAIQLTPFCLFACLLVLQAVGSAVAARQAAHRPSLLPTETPVCRPQQVRGLGRNQKAFTRRHRQPHNLLFVDLLLQQFGKTIAARRAHRFILHHKARVHRAQGPSRCRDGPNEMADLPPRLVDITRTLAPSP